MHRVFSIAGSRFLLFGISAFASVAVTGISLGALPAGAGSNWFGPAHFSAQLLVSEGTGNLRPLTFGTPVSSSLPSSARNRLNGFEAMSYLGSVGWAVGDLGQRGNSYEYPLYSTNHGETWTTAGPYFHGPWANGPNAVNRIRAFTTMIVMAYNTTGQIIFVSDDGGRHWYDSNAFSYIVSVSHVVSPTSTSPAGTIRIAVSKSGEAPARYVFTSMDSGREWVRHAVSP